jgi:aquaporin Z
VLGGTGAAVLAAQVDFAPGVGLTGVSLAFGLTVLTGAYALGHISGGHFNPAVTIGLVTARRFPIAEAGQYIVAQVVGAIAASGVVFAIVSGQPGFARADNFLAANGYGDSGSPGGYSMAAGLVAELVLTALFLIVILGVTDRRAPAGFAPLGIGLCLTLIHLISIPVTNTSVNPARSTGPAIFVGGDNLKQLWFFWLVPIVGGILGALIHQLVTPEEVEAPAETKIA